MGFIIYKSKVSKFVIKKIILFIDIDVGQRMWFPRKPHPLPNININKKDDLFDYEFGDFTLVDYKSHPFISAPIAV